MLASTKLKQAKRPKIFDYNLNQRQVNLRKALQAFLLFERLQIQVAKDICLQFQVKHLLLLRLGVAIKLLLRDMKLAPEQEIQGYKG